MLRSIDDESGTVTTGTHLEVGSTAQVDEVADAEHEQVGAAADEVALGVEHHGVARDRRFPPQ